MSSEISAADRLKHLRELMGLSREDFSKMLDIDEKRYKNLELKRVRLVEEDFAAVAKTLPDFLHWIIAASDLEWQNILNSQSVWTKLIGARIEAGQSFIGVRKAEKRLELVSDGDQTR